MSEPFVFDPRSTLCKTPFGAVACGHSVAFTCRPLLEEGFTHGVLILHREFAGLREEFALTLSPKAEGERSCFTLTLDTGEKPDLYWYHFRFWREDGSGCELDKTGYRCDGGVAPWQMTVYEENQTPQWFGGGLTYQIFPDRFHRLSIPDAEGLIGNRWVHENWDDTPEWRPDPDGEIRNRDFFGGSLAGVAAKLDYLAEMGVTTIYFCPIFESASNHRYNTANYEHIDPLLGTDEDFRSLCAKAKEKGIRIILDGVFNHIGSQSLYFNEDGFYPTLGAAQSKESPYYDWFDFRKWPTDYDSWWGFKTLPNVREECPAYVDYIIENKNSIIRRWLEAGASGWRLDVADELPDWFIEKIRAAMEETSPDSFLLGEVWEDASIKVAYNRRRKYLLGHELHSVMNYPFRTALLAYLKGGDADMFRETMETLRENYPRDAFYSAMNFLTTHDTPRILTLLGADSLPDTKDERAAFRLSPAQRTLGLERVRLAALMLYTFPGSPTVYYGDEAGMEGCEDPLNRGTYPWGHEDTALLEHFASLGRLRGEYTALRNGELHWLYTSGPLLAYAREDENARLSVVINADGAPHSLHLAWKHAGARDLLTGKVFIAEDGTLKLNLAPRQGLLLVE